MERKETQESISAGKFGQYILSLRMQQQLWSTEISLSDLVSMSFPQQTTSNSPTLGTLQPNNSLSLLSTFLPQWLQFPSIVSYCDSLFLSPLHTQIPQEIYILIVTVILQFEITPLSNILVPSQLRNGCLCQGTESHAICYIMLAQSGD